MSAGAYRGYGATQGVFALESAVNELARELQMDPTVIREKNMVHEGDLMPAYYGETANSCALDRCMARAKELMHWDEKYPCRDMGNGKVRSVGVAMCMQGSSISGVDVGSITLKLNDDGFYTMMIGAVRYGIPAVIPRWPRSPQTCWAVIWKTLCPMVWIRMFLRMIPVPMRPVPLT